MKKKIVFIKHSKFSCINAIDSTKIKVTFFILLFALLCHAQESYEDDFETYLAGSYVAASNSKWTTWKNQPGSTEDALVSTDQVQSGKNSLKISRNNNSDRTDAVLPFGAVFKTGNFKYNMSMFIPLGHKGYFNFQGEQKLGQTWAMDAHFSEKGDLVLTTGSNTTPLLTAKFPINEWFEIEFDINLSKNVWKVRINDECFGYFFNRNNSVASINFYASGGLTLYYIDNLSYEYVPFEPVLGIDGRISEFVWGKEKFTGRKDNPEISFTNLGDSIIETVDLFVSVNGTSKPVFLQDLMLKKDQTLKLKLQEITLNEGPNVIIINIVKINGIYNDEEICNNFLNIVVSAVNQAAHKAVLVEEGTGNWCSWCPRGAVFMKRYSKIYDSLFIPIAVHNGDSNPMRLKEYDSFMNFSAFPVFKVNRNVGVDPDKIEEPFLREISTPAHAKISTGAKYNASTRELSVSTTIEFLENISGSYNVNLVLTEDSIKGTTSSYNQANSYAGGSNGEMGGFELLPNPVPAAQMIYDHVARCIVGIVPNESTSFSGTYNKGEKVYLNFKIPMNVSWKKENLHLISILLENKTYINASSSTFDESLAMGFTSSNDNEFLKDEQVTIFPNPAFDFTNLNIVLTTQSNVEVTLRQISGRLIAKQDFGVMIGENVLNLPMHLLNAGVYLIEIKTIHGSRIEKIVVL